MNAKTAADALQDIAYLSVEIEKLENVAGELDAYRLRNTYALRGKRIMVALNNGVSAREIAEITQVGLAHV